MKLRDYQVKARNQVSAKLRLFGICYLAGEPRTGKTFVALEASRGFKTLFITKKSVIDDIEQQVIAAHHDDCKVINYESLHRVNVREYEFLILDEAHVLGQFPIAAKKTKALKQSITNQNILLLSGTPSPESYSQLFHQLWVTNRGPWTRFRNFYQFAHQYVNIKKVFVGAGMQVNDYSDGKPEILNDFAQYKVEMTQQQAGFDGEVIEKIHKLPMDPKCLVIYKALERDRVVDDYVADSGAKLMSLFHQLASGTAIDSVRIVNTISNYKAKYIDKHFKDRKIAIFYCYVEEGKMLERYFKDRITRSAQTFNDSSDLIFISQVVSGREGTNLSTADDLIFLNIGYSATSYFQARARSQSIKGGDKLLHWIFSIEGIESDIYETVKEKEPYTLKHFRKHYPEQNKKATKSKGLFGY